MILRHSKYPWYRITTLDDYFIFKHERTPLVESELRTIISLIMKEDERSITHNKSKTSEGGLLKALTQIHNYSLLGATEKLDELLNERDILQVQYLTEGKCININDMGGWNSDTDFLSDVEGEWEEVSDFKDKLFGQFLNPSKRKSNILLIENDTVLEERVIIGILKELGASYIDDINIIYAWDYIKSEKITLKFINDLIKEYGKLILIIQTTKIDDEKIQTLRKFEKYISTLYTNQAEALSEVGFSFEIKGFLDV